MVVLAQWCQVITRVVAHLDLLGSYVKQMAKVNNSFLFIKAYKRNKTVVWRLVPNFKVVKPCTGILPYNCSTTSTKY